MERDTLSTTRERKKVKGILSFHVCDLALLFYFCVMFAHQQVSLVGTMLRYASLFGVLISYIVCYPMQVGHNRGLLWRAGSFEIWMILLMVYSGLSMLWAIDAGYSYNSLFNTLKVMVVCFVVIQSLHTQAQIEHVLRLLLISLTYMLMILAVTTPFSTWGTERIGQSLGQHSNEIGRLCGLGSLLACYFFIKKDGLRLLYLLLMGAFSVCAFLTGSKNALFIILFQFGLFYFLVSGNWKRVLVIAGIIVLAILGYWLIMTNDMLYNLIGRRMEGLFNLFSGGNVDGSTSERLYFMVTAWDLFKEHPILGVGVDNFSAHLTRMRYSNAVYSHCGFLELLSTLGIIGFGIYYSQYIATLKGLFKPAMRRNVLAALMFTITARVLIFDLTSISMYVYNSYITLMLAFCLNRVLLNEDY